MKVYLNWRGPEGRETVDEFTKEAGQSVKDFLSYVRKMTQEYAMAGMHVYPSSRCCKSWEQA